MMMMMTPFKCKQLYIYMEAPNHFSASGSTECLAPCARHNALLHPPLKNVKKNYYLFSVKNHYTFNFRNVIFFLKNEKKNNFHRVCATVPVLLS